MNVAKRKLVCENTTLDASSAHNSTYTAHHMAYAVWRSSFIHFVGRLLFKHVCVCVRAVQNITPISMVIELSDPVCH